MFHWLRVLLLPPVFDDEDRSRVAVQFHWILVAFSIGALVSAASMLLATPISPRIAFPGLILALNSVCFVLMRSGRLQAAVIVFTSALWVLISVATYSGAGIYSASFAIYTLIIFLSAVLLSEYWAIVYMVLSLLWGVVMVYQHRQPDSFPGLQAMLSFPENTLTIHVTMLLTATTLVYFTARSIKAGFARARASERDLISRNRQLEEQVAERQRAESERDRFFDLSRDVLVIASVNGFFKRVNPTLESILGYTQEELLAVPYYSFVHPDDVKNTVNEVLALKSGAGEDIFENRFRCKNGEYRWLSWTTHYADGLLYGVARDVTDIRATQQALKESELRYRLLFENTGQATVLYDRNGKILHINQYAGRLFGRDSDELVGEKIGDLIPKHVADRYMIQIQRVIESGEAATIEDTITTADGEGNFIINIQPVVDADGHFIAAQVITNDITSLKQAERRQFELTLVKERAAFLSDFLNSVSHDLKTPLTVITTSLYLLERLEDPQLQREKIQRIGEQTRLVEKYIQDILTISRLEYLPSIALKAVRVNDQLAEILRQLRPKIERKALDIQLDLSADFPPITADYDQLFRALINLVENAINYTPNAGEIRLQTTTEEEILCVEISDTGIGIPEDELPHIFEPFYRSAHARKLLDGGTGLGLAIVRKIMDVHGFDIQVSSQPGQGTTFRMTIPRSSINLEEEIFAGS